MINITSSSGYRKRETTEYIKVRSCYTMTVGEEMMYSRRFLEYCEMIYVMTGNVYISVSGREHKVGAGEILVIPCYQTVDGVRKSNVKTTFCTCEFSCSNGLIEGISEQVVAICENEYFISSQFMRMNTLPPAEENGDSTECDALCLAILCALRNNIAAGEKSSTQILNSIIEYINENADKMLTVEVVADHFSYNKDYLIRLFKDRYGITIKKYINERKLAVVKRLLTTTDLPIKQIGMSIGFEEVELFEKFFKYHVKVTPQRYRKMNR